MKYLAILILAISCPWALSQAYTGQNQLGGVFRATVQPGQYVYFTFFLDGHARRNYPETGLDGFNDAYWMNLDFRSGIASKVMLWGTYQISGSQAQVVFADKDAWTLDISHYPQFITARNLVFVLLDPGYGLQLNGTYRSVNGDAAIQFTPDGQVAEQGIVANCVSGGQHFSYGGATPSMSSAAKLCLDKPLAGRYALGFYTVHFAFPDGTSPSFAFWAEPTQDRTNIRTIYINNVRYDLAL